MTERRYSGAKIDIPREEYDALIYLRDVTYEYLRAKCAQQEHVIVQYDLVQKADKQTIGSLSATLEAVRKKNLEQHALILKMQARLEQLEPVKCETPQPAFQRKP